MQITVTIPDELAAQAQVRGLALDRYLPALLAEALASKAIETTASPCHTAEQRRAAVETMLGFAEKHGFTTGGQSLKSMVHEGHKY